jgi:hypothetical protein
MTAEGVGEAVSVDIGGHTIMPVVPRESAYIDFKEMPILVVQVQARWGLEVSRDQHL